MYVLLILNGFFRHFDASHQRRNITGTRGCVRIGVRLLANSQLLAYRNTQLAVFALGATTGLTGGCYVDGSDIVPGWKTRPSR